MENFGIQIYVRVPKMSATKSDASAEEMKALAEEAGYRPAELSKLWGVSSRHAYRIFKQGFHSSPRELFDRMKVEAAQRMLAEGVSLKVVAAALGYNHASNFSRFFMSRTGLPPYRWLQFQKGTANYSI